MSYALCQYIDNIWQIVGMGKAEQLLRQISRFLMSHIVSELLKKTFPVCESVAAAVTWRITRTG